MEQEYLIYHSNTLTVYISRSQKFHYNDYHGIGFSTTHPSANVQRVYKEALLNTSGFVKDLVPYERLIAGASYTSTHCIIPNAMNSNRDNVVVELRRNGVRVDGLSNCLRSAMGPEEGGHASADERRRAQFSSKTTGDIKVYVPPGL